MKNAPTRTEPPSASKITQLILEAREQARNETAGEHDTAGRLQTEVAATLGEEWVPADQRSAGRRR